MNNGEDASRSAPSGERLAPSGSFSFFDRDAGAVAAAEAVAARVAKTRETRRPAPDAERPTPDAATDLLRGGPIGDFFRDENEDEDEDEDAFAFGAPRGDPKPRGTLNPDEETPVRARLAAMAARLDAGGLGVSIGEPGLARDAFAPLARRFPSSGKPRGKPGAEQRRQKTKAPKAKANKAKRTTTKTTNKAKKNAARGKNAEPDPYDVLAMPRRRAASPEPARPRPFRANPVPMSNYLPPRMVPELPGTRRSEFGRSFGFDATAAAAHEAEAVEATEERLAAVRIRREALAAARRNDERTLY